MHRYVIGLNLFISYLMMVYVLIDLLNHYINHNYAAFKYLIIILLAFGSYDTIKSIYHNYFKSQPSNTTTP